MKLYNSQSSGNCWKVRQILALLGIPYERVEVDVIDRSNRAEILGGKNPALRVPTLELDNGEHLAESNAILWYLADGTEYVPADPLERARALQWMFFEQYEVEPNLAVARFWVAILGERERYAAELEGKWRGGNRALDAIEGHLAGQRLARRRRLLDRGHLGLRVHARRRGGRLRPRAVLGHARVDRARRRPARLRADGGIADPFGALTRPVETVSLAQLRRYVVAHQGYTARFRRARAADVEAALRRLRAVQLDSISTVDRAHRLTLTSRIGAYPEPVVSRLLSEGRVFEYWAHEACLVPIEDWPLFKRRMEHLSEHHWWGRKHDHDPKVKKRVLDALGEHGPLPTRFFEGGGRAAGMWNWKPEKRILEDLFAAGEVVVAGRESFQRLYALPEQVIPQEYLDAPAPSEEEFVRGYVLRAVQARGALTESGIAEHCRFAGGIKAMRPVVDGLEREGLVRRVAVDDGGAPVVVPADARLDGAAPKGGVLLCPFDNMLWDRPFVERVFGFRHVIEVYKPAPQREYGYYVLPFLYGDRLVGRADLKADRGEGVLRVRAFHLEPKVRRSGALEAAFDKALARLARVARSHHVIEVSREEARRIAVRAQLLDGSARGVLSTVRRLGFLQIDTVSTVAPPQHLVLYSRVGPRYDRAELDRLLWKTRKLFEADAFIYPIEDLPLVLARMRRRREQNAREARIAAFLEENAAVRRYVLRELERRGPLLSREIEDHPGQKRAPHRWWGERKTALMLMVLSDRGKVAVVGRRQGQRVWDLAERWYPEVERIPWPEARRLVAERRARTQGVRFEKGRWLAHPEATDGPVPDHAVLLSPFDRLVYDRDRAEQLWDFRYRLEMFVPKEKREYGYYVLPLLVGDRVVGRAEPVFDAKTKTLRLLGSWGDTVASGRGAPRPRRLAGS